MRIVYVLFLNICTGVILQLPQIQIYKNYCYTISHLEFILINALLYLIEQRTLIYFTEIIMCGDTALADLIIKNNVWIN